MSLPRGTQVAMGTLLALCHTATAQAGSRARYGGNLHVALAGKPTEALAPHADTPVEATLLALTGRALCAAPFVLSRPAPLTLRIDVPAGVKPQDVAAALQKVQTEPTPYRALLSPVVQISPLAAAVELKLGYPWPDLESALCHPALALPDFGPFKLSSTAGRYVADTSFPGGRPYVDELSVTSTDERGAERLFTQRKVQLVLGSPPKEGATPSLPFATALLLGPNVPAPFRAALESAVDRTDLVRFFVRPPAAPMLTSGGLPRPTPLAPPKELTLSFDASLDDQRAVAARLQVRLNPLGYRLALKPLPRRALRAAWAAGSYDLMLFSALLPARPSNALAVSLEAARAPELIARHLPTLGAIADETARDDRAKALLVELGPSLRAVPLYVQGMALQAAGVQNLRVDAWGLPRLDDVFLGAE